MNTEELHGADIRRWNRKYLTSFWFILLISIFTAELNLIIGGEADWMGHLGKVIIPTGINLVLMGCAEYLFRRMAHRFHLVVVLIAILMCTVLIAANDDIDYIQALWVLPVLVSVFYFQRRLVWICTLLAISSNALLTLLHPRLYERTSLTEWITMPVILLVAALVTFSAMERGIELLKDLRSESEDKQELMIQNVIKDQMVRTDPLTGLYNRAALNEHLEMLLRYADSEGFSLHVAMLDVDHFKSVNDTYGHQAGDQVLKRMAAAIKDSIGNGDFAARYGGEEFTIVFTGQTVEEVSRLLEKIRLQVEGIVHPELNDRLVTISIGLCPYGKGMARERLFEHADACLYKAKRTGRNRLCSQL